MKRYKSYLLSLLTAALVGGLLWVNAARPVLLSNPHSSGDDVELGEELVPKAEVPPAEPADPFARFSQEELDTMNEVLELVNQARAEAGLTALELDPDLCGAAQVRAAECVGTFSHTRPDGTSYRTAIEAAGLACGYTGENAATGQTTAEQVVESWLKSEGHRANILNEHYARLGVGFSENTGNKYKGFAWVQLFSD